MFSADIDLFGSGSNEPAVKHVKNSYIVAFKPPELGEAPFIQVPEKKTIGSSQVPFGSHSTSQTKADVAKKLGLKGEVLSILDTINAIHVRIDETEARRLKNDKRVLYVEQDSIISTSATQYNPGWGLDRIDEQQAQVDNDYNYSYTGSGQTVYVLDSGLNLNNPYAQLEFGGRASIIWDVNGGDGEDCRGHGSRVSSAVAGSKHGVAKGAELIMAKITNGCTGSSNTSTSVLAFNWLATNAPAGTIVNWSHGYSDSLHMCTPFFSYSLENAIKSAYAAGLIIVVSAGNDSCNTADYSPTNIPEAFVVGSTNNNGIPGSDRKSSFSRTGWNISAFAPGENVLLMGEHGTSVTGNGTSFSAPYVSGIFAVACEAAAPLCESGDSFMLYEALRGTGTLGTVVDPDGSTLTGATSRFISQSW